MKYLAVGLSLGILACTATAAFAEGGNASEDAWNLELKQHETGRPVSLADQAGRILVLDFFAYWCAPCRTVSRAVEKEIRLPYELEGGNPAGRPVTVVSVNVEADRPELTEAFVRELGLGEVWHDQDGKLLAALDGHSLPFIVALDLTRNGVARVIFRSSGLESTAPLRAAIDEVGGGVRADDAVQRSSAAASSLRTEAVEVVFEADLAADIQLTQTLARFRSEGARTSWEAGVGLASIGLDYQPSPFDFLGADARVDKWRPSIAGNVRHRAGDRWTLLGSAGYYHGFADYRSAWFNEYFEQQFNNPTIGTVPGFEEADPQGFNVSGGLRFEYLPSSGFVEFNGTYLRDQIAPGYEIDFSGLNRGTDLLNSGVYRLTFENVPHRRIRTKLDLQLTDTTEREARYSVNGGVNVALGEKWTLRTLAGAAVEDPEFEAWYVGGFLEYALSDRWQLFAGGRYYADTGEIENSLSFSTAAPGLRSWHAGFGIRRMAGRSVFKLFVAPHFTDYDPVDLGTLFFANLYADRSWALVQAAWQLEF